MQSSRQCGDHYLATEVPAPLGQQKTFPQHSLHAGPRARHFRSINSTGPFSRGSSMICFTDEGKNEVACPGSTNSWQEALQDLTAGFIVLTAQLRESSPHCSEVRWNVKGDYNWHHHRQQVKKGPWLTTEETEAPGDKMTSSTSVTFLVTEEGAQSLATHWRGLPTTRPDEGDGSLTTPTTHWTGTAPQVCVNHKPFTRTWILGYP